MHKSVLLQETIDQLNLKPGQKVIDATIGAGGHSKEILKRVGKKGSLLGLDKDETALELVKTDLGGCSNLVLAHSDFRNISKVAKDKGFGQVDAILADIGVSSMQLDQPERGFSFRGHAKLDMRMDKKSSLTAADVVNNYTKEELNRIFRQYGEEPKAARIASEIEIERSIHPIIYTDQLSEVVRRVVPIINRGRGQGTGKTRIDPSTKVFQALRIEVNGELSALESALPQMVGLLKKGGRIAIISFHSLEDRIVKVFFEEKSKTCVCPPDYPKCICNTRAELKKVTRKPIIASETELSENPRSRSAKLRVAEKI